MAKTELYLKKADLINEWTGRIVAFAMLPLTVITVLEVVLRYVFNRPTLWAWEVNMMLFGFMIAMGAGYTLLYGSHVIVDVLINRLSRRQRALLDLITAVLFFFVCVTLIWKSGLAAWASIKIGESYSSIWEPPIYPLKITVPIGAFLLMVQGLAKFVRDLIIVVGPRQVLEEAKSREH